MEDIIIRLETAIGESRLAQIYIANVEDDSDDMNEAYIQTRTAIKALRRALEIIKEVQ